MKFVTRPNSWVSQDVAATTQLTYGLQLNPAPLTVSISGSDPVMGSLEFVITNPTASAIALSSIAFTIQVGTDGSDLTTTTANISTSVSDTTDWQIEMPGTITSGPAVYTLAPHTGSSASVAAGASIIVEIYNFPTVENPGNTTINIKETVGSTTIGFTSFMVTTFPSGFYFNGLSATIENGSQLVPAAQVVTGATVTLVWNSSVVDLASSTIYYSNAAQGQQSATPTDTGLWTSGPLTADTFFTVVVTVSVAGGTPLTAALSTAVAVQNPSLIAAALTASTAAVNGPLTVSGATQANAITSTGLVVNGNVSATGALSVTGQSNLGPVSLNGNLNVSGNGTLGTLNVSGAASTGALQAASFNTGSASISNASISNATMNGLSASGGRVSLISGAQAITPGSSWSSPNGYTAPTDGFAIGAIGFPNSSSPGCMCYGYGQSIGVTVWCTGGNVGFFGPGWDDYMANNPNSFVLPVPAGNNFYIAAQQASGDGQQANAPFWFYWVPMGAGNVGATLTKLDKPGADFIQPPLFAGKLRHEISNSFIEALEELTGKKIDGKMRKKLLGRA